MPPYTTIWWPAGELATLYYSMAPSVLSSFTNQFRVSFTYLLLWLGLVLRKVSCEGERGCGIEGSETAYSSLFMMRFRLSVELGLRLRFFLVEA